MQKNCTRYVICYDIPDDKRRTHLAKCLDSYGDRIQFSVFEAVLDDKLFDKLIDGIQNCIDDQEDFVTVYALCGACNKRIQRLGVLPSGPGVGEEIVCGMI